MGRTLTIDPGNTESAYTVIDTHTCKPQLFAKVSNDQLRQELPTLLRGAELVAVEMIASYGMAVGAEVFETCVWIGKFSETIRRATGEDPDLVKRLRVKTHHCHDSKATDSNISQALKDRFAYGVRNHGKGTKDAPGWFYGFYKDVWQAYALAVLVADEGTHRAVA